MTYVVSAADRAAFKRCRRQWDFSATMRRRRAPNRRCHDLDRAIHDALAVYYFPGMWDWNSAIVLPLVLKAFDDSLQRQRAGLDERHCSTDWQALMTTGHDILERYFTWAPRVDRFSPVRVATDFEALVPDPADPERGLPGPDGSGVTYTGRIDLLAIDEHDNYWIVRHCLSGKPFPATEQLLLDEESLTACWAWERYYDGMAITGTIYNEISSTAAAPGERTTLAQHRRGGIPQHEPSGGGRGVSSPRRIYVKGRPAENAERVVQTAGDGVRRTTVRRDRTEVRSAGAQLATEILDMVRGDLRIYPNPAPSHCATCDFVAPCLALHEDRDADAILTEHFHRRAEIDVEPGRLGGSPHGVGRGWVLGSQL